MKTLSLRTLADIPVMKKIEPYLIALILLLVWFSAQKLMIFIDSTAGQIDPSIWLLVLLAMISFLLMLTLCWWLLKRIWVYMRLPGLDEIFMEFNGLDVWEKLKFVLGLFALLLLGAVGALIAVL